MTARRTFNSSECVTLCVKAQASVSRVTSSWILIKKFEIFVWRKLPPIAVWLMTGGTPPALALCARPP